MTEKKIEQGVIDTLPELEGSYSKPSANPSYGVREDSIEYGFIGKLQSLKYEYRKDIRDRAALEQNFREKFEALNRVRLTDSEFSRLLEEIVTPDVFTAARTLRERNSFTRDDGTPIFDSKAWVSGCEMTFTRNYAQTEKTSA